MPGSDINIIFPLTRKNLLGGSEEEGISPFMGGMNPLPAPPAIYIFGVTRDSNGTRLGNCQVALYRTLDDSFVERVPSDISGNYQFSPVGAGQQYYVVAYKKGSPDVEGTTVNTLEGTVLTVAPITQVQKKGYGSTSSLTNHSVVFNSTPTAGNLMILCVVANVTISGTPAGWTAVASAVDQTGTYMYYKVAGSSESPTVTVTLSSASSCALGVFEYVTPTVLDQFATATGQGGAGTVNTGTTPSTTKPVELVLCLAGLSLVVAGSGQTVTAWSNGVAIELAAETLAPVVRLEVGTQIISGTGTQTSTATLSVIGATGDSGIIGTFK